MGAESKMGKVMQAGADAFRAGLPVTANPYNDTMHRTHWNMGWVDAAVDAGVLTRY